MMIRTWMKMLLAILIGNVIYFAVMAFLPDYLHHRLYAFDPGLALDLLICICVYFVIRTGC